MRGGEAGVSTRTFWAASCRRWVVSGGFGSRELQDPGCRSPALLFGLLSHQHPWLKGGRSPLPVVSAIYYPLFLPLPDLSVRTFAA